MGSAQQQGKVLVQPMRPTNDGLIAGTLLYRIWATTRLHGCDLAPSKVHGTWSLWARLTDRLQNLLMLANRDIQIEAKTQDVLTCVYGMVLIEVCVIFFITWLYFIADTVIGSPGAIGMAAASRRLHGASSCSRRARIASTVKSSDVEYSARSNDVRILTFQKVNLLI